MFRRMHNIIFNFYKVLRTRREYEHTVDTESVRVSESLGAYATPDLGNVSNTLGQTRVSDLQNTRLHADVYQSKLFLFEQENI